MVHFHPIALGSDISPLLLCAKYVCSAVPLSRVFVMCVLVHGIHSDLARWRNKFFHEICLCWTDLLGITYMDITNYFDSFDIILLKSHYEKLKAEKGIQGNNKKYTVVNHLRYGYSTRFTVLHEHFSLYTYSHARPCLCGAVILIISKLLGGLVTHGLFVISLINCAA